MDLLVAVHAFNDVYVGVVFSRWDITTEVYELVN